MSDIVIEPDTVAEKTDGAVVEEQTLCSVKDDNPNSTKRTKTKSKKSKSDKRKNRSSSKSHKAKSAPKIEDIRSSKDDSDARERPSSPEKCDQDDSHKYVKEELLSDGQDSSVSEKRRLLLTRSRIRRIQRRKAYSSNSSAPESDYRKTKSEPIIITLDSDSEGAMSLVSNRPNRSARIKGEMSRKLSGTTTKMDSYKSCDSSSSSSSSSSSDSENDKRKKKSKSKSVKSSSSQAAKRKKYLVKHLTSKSRLKVRKHRKHVTTVYTAARPKRNITSIRKRLVAQKRVKIHEKNFSPVTTRKRSESHQNTKIVGRRTLRSKSTDVSADNKLKQDDADAVQTKTIDSEFSKSQSTIAKSSDAKKSSDSMNIKKQAKKESMVIPPEEGEKISKNMVEAVEAEMVNETGENMEATSHATTNEQDPVEKTEPMPSEGSNEDIQPDTAKLEPDNSKVVKAQSVSKFPQKVKKIKKKLKPSENMIVRKRGRPRLSDLKPVKDIPVLNDMIQIPFLQSSFCFDVAPKLPKCRECRFIVAHSKRTMFHAYCRFMEYRKLCYHKNGTILNAGFSEPSEAMSEHLNQWLPQLDDPPKDLNLNTSKALIEHIGDQFCDLIEQEKEALSLHVGKDKVVTWKRIVQGVREMCDVCYTTLFNIHWVCPICGLAVCIDCYKGRLQGIMVEYEDGQPKNRDQYNWLLCTTMKQPHDPKKLLMAQIIPGNALWTMRDLLHKARKMWDIPSYCKCNPHEVTLSDKHISTGICKQLMCSVTKSFSSERSNFFFTNSTNNAHNNNESNYDDLDFEVSGSALKWLEGDLDGLKSSEDYYSCEDYASLRGNLLNCASEDDNFSESEREITSFSLDDIIACVTKPQNSDNKENSGKLAVKYFSHRYPQPNSGRDPLPIRIYTKLESDLAFSNVPHSWFCNGRLLFLLQSDHQDNLALFQEQWKRGQPVLVKGVDERLSIDLWHPDAFCRDFGEVKNDLVDCRTGAIIKNLPMRKFWEGFESFDKRLKDDDGECRLLKLKDWPPGEDFSEKLPRRFHDLMNGLPLPEYTHRDGVLNLAGRLPPWFVRPDLGPKMYNAYGSALYPTKGTTNLHLDISDAVNVMVYVGIPQDGNAQLHIEEALKAIDEGGCDSLMRARVRSRGAKPGALWHIYNARDADKIRELLTKAAIERGEKLEAHHDPIHDQSWYLDAELRKRLYRDYGVEGYAIAQCLGDAVFIPAGAPHQVRNLHSCVKVAEDFVSPENIAHCFKLTQEFRHLTDSHTNHEDKLQIKNIIYHVVRDALAYLLADVECLESLES